MKKIKISLLLFLIIIPMKVKAENNMVNMYLFYGDGCPHCAALEEALDEIKGEYPNLKVHMFEVWKNPNNGKLMNKAANLLGAKVTGVPFAVIGTRTFVGYSETLTRGQIEHAVKLYSKTNQAKDPVGEMLGIVYKTGDLTYEDLDYKYGKEINEEQEYMINVPFVGEVAAKELSLPIIAISIGAIDGFNPCAMWVLIFLISALIGMKDRKKMWILGSVFLLTSALMYLIFMLAWLNLVTFIAAVWWIKMFIASVALIAGYLNLKAFIKSREAGCEVVDDKKRKNIIAKIKKVTREKSLVLSILGIITLAVSVNFIELTCSAGLPVAFTNILGVNNLTTMQYAFYMFLYILFFLLDDLIIFIIAMVTFKVTGISNKYTKYSHLIGGIMMLIIGLLMIFKPEWLMFNF